MDLALTEEQEMLRKTARDFLELECPKSLVRQMEEDEKGYSPQLWRKMAELGWVGLIFPEKYGGGGSSFLDLTVLLEELGRALVPSPFLAHVVCCGLAILEAGTDEQKQTFLPQLASGQTVMTLALNELDANYRASDITVQASPNKDSYIVTGTKLFVSDAHVADWFLCVARTRRTRSPESGITLLLIDAKSRGLSYTPLKTIASDKQFEVVLDKVAVPRTNILGKLDGGWETVNKMTERAAVAECALMVGGGQKVLEMTVSYAKERVQFGQPIGSFQAIQHKCANMLTDLDGARLTTYLAAWKLSQGFPATMEAATAKACTSDAYRRICAEAHQILGGVGLMKDHDMHLYFRRAKASELAFGDAGFHRETVAQQILS